MAGVSVWPETDRWPAASTTMTYRVALYRSEEGVCAYVPGLPGCTSHGADEGEALENVRRAIRDYLEVQAVLLDGEDVREVEVTL